MKIKLLLLIDNLNLGGAEILLTGVLKDLHERFEIILTTLTDECQFNLDEILYEHRYILNFGKNVSIFRSVTTLRKIIKKHNPNLIHAHLFYSSLVARLACFSKIPVIYSLHSELSKNIFKHKWWLLLLEKVTIRKNHFPLGVSQKVMEDYRKTVGYKGDGAILKNYIDDQYFQNGNEWKDIANKSNLKIIAVGNIKKVKNYGYLISSFSYLKKNSISLEIFGKEDKELSSIYNEKIRHENLKIQFKGAERNLSNIYPKYDLFVSSSLHEGFGLSVIEAMASGVPVLLSDIPVYHEITMDNALFFDLENPEALTDLIEKISQGDIDLKKLRQRGFEISKLYTKKLYLDRLYAIYERFHPLV